MRTFKILGRLIRQEIMAVLFLAALYTLPLLVRILSHGALIKNLVPFFVLIPLGVYPVLFFIRGILIVKKEWDSGTIIHYFSSGVSSMEFTMAYSLYMLFEVFFLYLVPLILFSLLSTSKGVIVQFTPQAGSFFLPVPVFFLSYLFGYSLYIFSRGLYIQRGTITFFAGVFAFVVYVVLYVKLKSIIPSPFTFHIFTGREHIVHRGSFLFVYPLFVSVFLFLSNLYLYKRSEY